MRIRDIKTNKTQTKYNNNDYDDKYIVENGDLIIEMDGKFNAVTWNGGSALLNQRVCKLIPNSKILPSHLFHLIQNPLKVIEDCTTFTTVKHISSKQIVGILIPLPPFEEQHKIVEKLDAIEKSIQSAKYLIESLKQGGHFISSLGIKMLSLWSLAIVLKKLTTSILKFKNAMLCQMESVR